MSAGRAYGHRERCPGADCSSPAIQHRKAAAGSLSRVRTDGRSTSAGPSKDSAPLIDLDEATPRRTNATGALARDHQLGGASDDREAMKAYQVDANPPQIISCSSCLYVILCRDACKRCLLHPATGDTGADAQAALRKLIANRLGDDLACYRAEGCARGRRLDAPERCDVDNHVGDVGIATCPSLSQHQERATRGPARRHRYVGIVAYG